MFRYSDSVRSDTRPFSLLYAHETQESQQRHCLWHSEEAAIDMSDSNTEPMPAMGSGSVAVSVWGNKKERSDRLLDQS